jgi:hypothetical protein
MPWRGAAASMTAAVSRPRGSVEKTQNTAANPRSCQPSTTTAGVLAGQPPMARSGTRQGLSNRTLAGVDEGLAHATGAAPLFTSQVSAFLTLGPASP